MRIITFCWNCKQVELMELIPNTYKDSPLGKLELHCKVCKNYIGAIFDN